MSRPKKKPEDSKGFMIGDRVYTVDNYNGHIKSGVIEEYLSANIVSVHFDAPWYGTAGRMITDCYPSREACEHALKMITAETIQAYCDSIETVNDLVNFALKYCIGPGEEYTDWAAREAYIKRAKDFGITIDE